MFTSTLAGHAPTHRKQGPDHGWIISQYDGACVYPHRRVGPQCDGNKDLITDGSCQCGGVSVHYSRSQMPTVTAMTITIDSLLPRPKLDYDGGYDVAVKGLSVVVIMPRNSRIA
jgi:hypothetical protein